MTDIESNVKRLLSEIPPFNPQGERVDLVAAVKTQTPEDIDRAVAAGIKMIADNHVQEFRDKYDLIHGRPQRHFIGHLQTNKIKYLLGKTDLYHSIDRYNLAQELSKRGAAAGVTSDILIEINIGGEESKSGFAPEEADRAVETISALPALRIKGLMAMLPESDDEALLRRLATRMRGIYDGLKATHPDFEHLSMGMSGDWRLCVECGSNMIRLGTAIFGQRQYNSPKPANS